MRLNIFIFSCISLSIMSPALGDEQREASEELNCIFYRVALEPWGGDGKLAVVKKFRAVGDDLNRASDMFEFYGIPFRYDAKKREIFISCENYSSLGHMATLTARIENENWIRPEIIKQNDKN